MTLGIRVLSVPAGAESRVAQALARNPAVEFAEPDWIRTFSDPASMPVDDPFIFWDGDAEDDGRGTHVAGIAAARGNDGAGVSGVAWSDGAHVLNLSLGGGTGSETTRSALQYARSNGVLPFCAAGNDGGAVPCPAAWSECVAVSATDWGDDLASYSNSGPEVELSAPGGDGEDFYGSRCNLSAYNGSSTSYAFLAGTSMASPQAAGLGAPLHALGVAGDDEKLPSRRARRTPWGRLGPTTGAATSRRRAPPTTAPTPIPLTPGEAAPTCTGSASRERAPAPARSP
jgi:subtilisin family serine protease